MQSHATFVACTSLCQAECPPNAPALPASIEPLFDEAAARFDQRSVAGNSGRKAEPGAGAGGFSPERSETMIDDTETLDMIHEDALPGHESALEPKPDWEPLHPGSGRLQGKVALVTGADSGIGRA